MVKKNNKSPIEQVQKYKEYISPQVENYLAFRLAKKSFVIIITTIGLLTALVGYFGISYTKDLRQNLEEMRSTIANFKEEISNERNTLKREISSFHDRMDEELKNYDNLSNKYEKSLSNFETRSTNQDQHMDIVMETFLNNLAKSTEKLYEEISDINELNERSRELIRDHKRMQEDLVNFKNGLETEQKNFFDEYVPQLNEILESQIIWIRQDIGETESGFKIADKNLVIKFTDITIKGKRQLAVGLRVCSSNHKIIISRQDFEVGEKVEFTHPETKEKYVLELELIIDNEFDCDYAGFIIRTQK